MRDLNFDTEEKQNRANDKSSVLQSNKINRQMIKTESSKLTQSNEHRKSFKENELNNKVHKAPLPISSSAKSKKMRLSLNKIKLDTKEKSKGINSSFCNQESDDLMEIQTVINLEETGNKSSIRKVPDNTKSEVHEKSTKKISIIDKFANRKLNMSLIRDKENRNPNSTTLREKNDKSSDLKSKFNSAGNNYFS